MFNIVIKYAHIPIIFPWVHSEPNVLDLRSMDVVVESINDYVGLLLKLRTHTFITNQKKNTTVQENKKKTLLKFIYW